MKKLINKVFLLPMLIIGMIVIFSTCKKDETCEAIIKVKYKGIDSNLTVPVSMIVIGKYVEQLDGSNKGSSDTGYTSTASEYNYKKDLEAILDVDVTLDTTYAKTHVMKYRHYTGSDVLRLRAGKTVSLTVYIEPVDSLSVMK